MEGTYTTLSDLYLFEAGVADAKKNEDSGEVLNHGKGVLIEPAVWIGEAAKILKGVVIGFGAIVGAGSIVTKDVARNSLVAGVPARVIRNNVGWTRVPNPDKESGRKIREYQRSLGML